MLQRERKIGIAALTTCTPLPEIKCPSLLDDVTELAVTELAVTELATTELPDHRSDATAHVRTTKR
jgi:hypothetical protein